MKFSDAFTLLIRTRRNGQNAAVMGLKFALRIFAPPLRTFTHIDGGGGDAFLKKLQFFRKIQFDFI